MRPVDYQKSAIQRVIDAMRAELQREPVQDGATIERLRINIKGWADMLELARDMLQAKGAV
jgi:hypothetical protein